jgi:hypothetical protein
MGLISVAVGGLGGIPLTTALAVGLAGGLILGLMTGLLGWSATPLPDDLAQTPAGTLRRDLQLSVGRTIAALFVGGFILGLMTALEGGLVVLLLVLGGGGASVVLLMFIPVRYIGTVTASSVYLGIVTLLSTQRRVPRQLMRFLDDAHRTGLLRQVGPVYQFRHAKLQDRLAHTYRQGM